MGASEDTADGSDDAGLIKEVYLKHSGRKLGYKHLNHL